MSGDTTHDWWQDVYEGHVVPVMSSDGLTRGLAVRAWYADGDRQVRIVTEGPDGEVTTHPGMWTQPLPLIDEIIATQPTEPTTTALAEQTVRAWATVDTATGLVVGLHEGAATARAAARRAVANGGLVRAEHLTLLVVRP